MKKVILILSLIFTVNSFAKNTPGDGVKTGTIIGKVMNMANKPLPYVSVVIKDTAKKSITGGITDDQGNFQINKIPLGDLIIEINFMGFETITKKVKLSTSRTMDLGSFKLKESSAVLDEVTVVAETSTVVQKIDRKVINVGKDLTSAGATASQLLNNVQSVSVDSQTGQISLRGNENVRVLIDGKPSNVNVAQLLKQIPSTSIKSVELITNPSAKYNPEGMSGIINIVLHKNANIGFNGSVNTGLTRGENTRFNGSLDMNFKTGKVNFFANYGYNDGKRDNYGRVIRNDKSFTQNFEWDSDNTSHLLKAGVDIYLNDKNTFSFYTVQNNNDSYSSGSTLIRDIALVPVNDTRNTSTSENSSETYNFNYTHDFDKKGESLELEANISKNDRPEDAVFSDVLTRYDKTLNYVDDVANIRKNQLYNLDYTNPVSENAKLELGLEVRLNTTDNQRITGQHRFIYELDDKGTVDEGDDEYVRIPELINFEGTPENWFEMEKMENSSFSYDRKIYSAYVNYNQKIEKVSMQLGARFEQYEVEGNFKLDTENEPYTDEIFTVYPSAFLTYNANEKNQFQWSYSRRVDRPSLGQVNPIREWSTPLITSIGNPELKPQFTNSFEFNYTRQLPKNKGSVTFGTFYRRVNDNISRILNVDKVNAEKVELSYANLSKSNRYGFELSSNYALRNWWRVNASMDLYIQKEAGISGTDNVEVTNNAFNIRINNSISATKKLRFQLFGMYRGGAKGIQFDRDPMWMVNTGASLTVLKGKGTISMNFNDVFKAMQFKFNTKRPIPQHGDFHWESRTVYLGFMYRFGGGKNRAKGRKRRDSNETSGGGFM